VAYKTRLTRSNLSVASLTFRTRTNNNLFALGRFADEMTICTDRINPIRTAETGDQHSPDIPPAALSISRAHFSSLPWSLVCSTGWSLMLP